MFSNEGINSDNISLSSFKVKNTLNPVLWSKGILNRYVMRKLLIITKDFITNAGIGSYDIEDVIITGSCANYNWNSIYSDIDLHIVMDVSIFNKDPELAKIIADNIKNNWNRTHEDIRIKNMPVELYIQDINEPHKSSGMYSILNDKWIIKPSKTNFNVKLDKKNIQNVISKFMNKIDTLESFYGEISSDVLYEKCEKLLNAIKEYRMHSLNKVDSNEYSSGNIVFKYLRRSGYIEKLITLKRKCFDVSRSI